MKNEPDERFGLDPFAFAGEANASLRSNSDPAWADAAEVDDGTGGDEGPRESDPRPAKSSIGLLFAAFVVVGVDAAFGEGAANAESSSKSINDTCCACAFAFDEGPPASLQTTTSSSMSQLRARGKASRQFR